jgi:hypothetical protein
MRLPLPKEYPAYFGNYIKLVETNDIIKLLDEQVVDIQELLSNVEEEQEDFAYEPGKWTIKEVIGHIIDTERIMAYRALRFARKDKTALAGFDENNYVANANFGKRTLYDLAHEFALLRESNIALFKHFDTEMLDQIGIANDNGVSVRSLLYMIAGHAAHHVNVLKTRYLVGE